MTARAVDDVARRLRELRLEERDELAVAAVGLALSLAATQVYPALAIPLFLGALVAGARGVRASWRRWEIVDELSGDRDAYAIPEVFARASREATLERRRTFAAILRTWLRGPGLETGVAAARDDLEALVADLEDERLGLDVPSAVACKRLVGEWTESALLDTTRPPEDLRAQVRRIRGGFTRRAAA